MAWGDGDEVVRPPKGREGASWGDADEVVRPAIFDPIGDLGRAVGGAANAFGEKYAAYNDAIAARAQGGRVKLPERPGLGDLLAIPLQAIQGATTDQITAPAARGLSRTGLPVYERQSFGDAISGKAPVRLHGQRRIDAIKEAFDTSLMGARPVLRGSTVAARGGKVYQPAQVTERAKATPAQLKVGEVVTKRMGADPIAEAAAMERSVPTYMQGGDELAAVAEVAAQSPGPARSALRTAARDYSAQAPKRTKADIEQAMGGRGDYFAALDKKIAERAELSAPSRERAFAAPIDSAAYGETIAPLMPRVPGRAIGYAREIARREGVNPDDLGIQVLDVPAAPTTEMRPVTVTERGPLGEPVEVTRMQPVRVEGEMQPQEFIISRPTMKTLHYIKKGIDQELENYRNAVTGKLEVGNGLGAATARLRSEYGQALRKANPDYDEFMRIWGDESGHVTALGLGRDVLSASKDMNAEQLAARVKGMNDVERDFFRKGVGEALISQVRRRGDVASLRQLLKNEEFGDRVALAFPDDQSFASFMESAAKRVAQQDRNNQVFGGSPTYARQAARADLEAEGGEVADTALDLITLDGKALAKKAAKAGLKGRRKSVISDPVMNELLGKVMSDPEELTALLNLLQAARASSASRAAVARQAALPALTTNAAPTKD